MELKQRIASFSRLGELIREKIERFEPGGINNNNDISLLINKAQQKNAWFTPSNIKQSLLAIASWLDTNELEKWLAAYSNVNVKAVEVGVIMAGNIPLVGFHDFLCVLMSGQSIAIKSSSDDEVLLPAVVDWLVKIEPEWNNKIRFVSRIEKPGAVIATGSNNSARYFEYYFGKYPHIIRRNRNSVAVITGQESREELVSLGTDIFSYFGLGCRNVSKLYIPQGYILDPFFQAIEQYAPAMMDHNKYMNNYDYHNAIFLLNSAPFLTNNFLIVRQHEALATPVSVLHYEYYKNEQDLQQKLKDQEENIQCIVGKKFIPFGKSQMPGLSDYADGVDVMKFLEGI
jgi:hypothetical protein